MCEMIKIYVCVCSSITVRHKQGVIFLLNVYTPSLEANITDKLKQN